MFQNYKRSMKMNMFTGTLGHIEKIPKNLKIELDAQKIKRSLYEVVDI